MKKLLVAFVISISVALGFGGSAMAVVLTTPGTTVVVPCEADAGAVTAVINIDAAGAEPPLDVNFIC